MELCEAFEVRVFDEEKPVEGEVFELLPEKREELPQEEPLPPEEPLLLPPVLLLPHELPLLLLLLLPHEEELRLLLLLLLKPLLRLLLPPLNPPLLRPPPPLAPRAHSESGKLRSRRPARRRRRSVAMVFRSVDYQAITRARSTAMAT